MTEEKAGKNHRKQSRRDRFDKILTIILSVSLLLGSAGCGQAGKTGQEAASTEEQQAGGTAESVYSHLRVSMLVPVDAQPDLGRVEDVLNEVTRRQLGAEVELVPVRMTDFSDIYIQRMTEGEAIDLMLLSSGTDYLARYANSGLIQPIDDYMGRAANYLRYMMGMGLEAGKYQDRQYGIPQETNRVGVYAKGFNLSREICDQYGIDPAGIRTVEDLEAVFDFVHEKDPGLTILMPETPYYGIADSLAPYYDTLTTGPGYLTSDTDTGEIVFEMEEQVVQDAVAVVHRWYEKGFIPQNVNTTDEYGSDMLHAGECFATASDTIGPEMGGIDYYSVRIVQDAPLMTTDQEDAFLWVVSAQCSAPKLAVSFLNLCYRDSFVSNLLYYGINRVHYKTMKDGTLDISGNAGYSNNWIQFGKISNLCFTVKDLQAAEITQGIQTVDKLQMFYREWETEKSVAYGFFFDPVDVELEVTACAEVSDQYELLLKNGTTDPSTELEKYIQEMYNAGMEKIIREKERQLGEWMAEQGIQAESFAEEPE